MSWIEEEKAKLDKEREDFLESMGFEPLFKFPQGETRVKVSPAKEPKEVKIADRKIKVFDVEVDGKTVSVGISQKSPLYREILSQLINRKYEFIVIRTGTGLATRYAIKQI